MSFDEVLDIDDKKIVFERFLTYRRRMARLCAVQSLYLYEMKLKTGLIANNHVSVISESDMSLIFQSVLYFYKSIFFIRHEYGSNRKNKKIDESYFFDVASMAIKNSDQIDSIISKYINERWTVSRLDSVVRAILRCAVSEILYQAATDIPILTSEYTNIASSFFQGKEIGFVNGVIDKIIKDHRSSRPTAI